MFRNWGIGKKLVMGFTCVALVAMALGVIGYWNALQSQKHIQQIAQVEFPAVENLLAIKVQAYHLRAATRTLLDLGLDPSLRKRQYETVNKSREKYQKAMRAYELLPKSAEEAELWKQFVPAWEKWGKDTDQFLELSRKLDALDIGDPAQLTVDLRKFKADYYKLVAQLRALIYEGQQFQGGEDHTASDYGKWLASYKTSNKEVQDLLSKAKESHRKFHEHIRKIKERYSAGSAKDSSLFLKEATEFMKDTFSILDQLENTAQKAVELFHEMEHQLVVVARQAQEEANGLLDKLIECATRDAALGSQAATSQASFVKIFSLVALAAGVLLAGVLGFSITRSLSRSLRNASNCLSTTSEQVASAASQISSSSQKLAEGASEQAASLEETSSSLEEIASMAKQNADNAIQAKNMMTQANQIIEKVGRHMERMAKAIEDITRQSEETGKIIKIIDEVAFQTNLLALNAAVEAARAGESGAGFAVVADEVRNLAQRAAEAAKNTGSLIEATIKAVREGREVTSLTQEAFKENVEIGGKVSQLVQEIAAASQEQAQGVEQIAQAVAQMDKVVQSTAASTEESASASEELQAQAQAMKEMVGELVALVEGKNGNGYKPKGSGLIAQVEQRGDHYKNDSRPEAALAPKEPLFPKGNGGQRPTRKGPQELIPLDEDNKNFTSF